MTCTFCKFDNPYDSSPLCMWIDTGADVWVMSPLYESCPLYMSHVCYTKSSNSVLCELTMVLTFEDLLLQFWQGNVKGVIAPEDISMNCSEDAKPPRCPLPGGYISCFILQVYMKCTHSMKHEFSTGHAPPPPPYQVDTCHISYSCFVLHVYVWTLHVMWNMKCVCNMWCEMHN